MIVEITFDCREKKLERTTFHAPTSRTQPFESALKIT
jgi:hypothetical protein